MADGSIVTIVTDPPYGIAAHLTDRNWLGCELDTDMYNKATDWLNNYDKELAKEYI